MGIVAKRDKRIFISFLFTLLLCVMFIPFFSNNILNGDESVTLLYCKSDIKSITEWAARDYHPLCIIICCILFYGCQIIIL